MAAKHLKKRAKPKVSERAANKKWSPPDYSPKGLARMLARMAPKEIANYNEGVAKHRLAKLKELRSLLRDKKVGPLLLDLETRGVARKFARLPFGCICDSCAGHLMDEPIMGERIALEKIGPNQKVFATGADFELALDFSPQAMEFRKALEEFDKRVPFARVTWGGSLSYVSVPINPSKKFGKRDAVEIRKLNLRFLEEFEKLVDGFAKKYGVRVKL